MHRHRQTFPHSPLAHPTSIIGGSPHPYRLTVLTPGLIRYEYSPDSVFEDRASVFAVNRSFLPTPDFRIKESDDKLEIITERIHVTYDKQEFHASGLSFLVKGRHREHASVWHFGEETPNLGGTARTLDEADGRIALGPGVCSKSGFSVIDDSGSMIFDEDGYANVRKGGEGRVDGYFFGFGHDYREAVKALYGLSGMQPLLPRWALGNWWSRYYAYTAGEYLELMDRFKDEGIPLSVAVLDMDWHLVDDEVVLESGSVGWTGYTWNKKLFPDPPAFLKELRQRKLKVTLNDHPADGVYPYEDAYEEVCKAVKQDPSTKDPVQFDIVDHKFLNAYFDVLMRGLQKDGMDFCWIDWQQGTHTRLKGIDPLWVLNHFHFRDNTINHNRPLTFSRYAGPGSHRYPVGFSGDTIVTWASLDFQPEFTLTASNIGYGWWSHDIGGHMFGGKDDQLATRWIQFGTFSPILRLHSSNSRWTSKEPWGFGMEAQKVMTDFLRFRHRLLPYLCAMNLRAAEEGTPLVQPMYWDYPKQSEAYRVKNQYFFGSELIVMPITSPQDPKICLARVRGWLPPGRYVDIFTGAVYDGDRELWISRSLAGFPVFATEGAIIPLDAAAIPGNGCENTNSFEVLLVVGKDGEFEIVEDDGTGSSLEEVEWTRTLIKYTQLDGTVEIGPTQGPLVTGSRDWSLRLLSLSKLKTLRVLVDGSEVKATQEKVPNGLLVRIGQISKSSKAVIELGKNLQLGVNDPASLIKPFLGQAQLDFGLKEGIWDVVTAKVPKTLQVSRLHALEMEPHLLESLLELVLADHRVDGWVSEGQEQR